jgi:mannosyltransferase
VLRTLQGPGRSRYREPPRPAAGYLAVAGLLVLALVIALIKLDSKSIIYDESVSGGYAFVGWSRLWQVITGPDPNMGLYYLLLHFWARIFGHGVGTMRVMSVVFGALSVPAAVAVGSRMFGRAAGLASGLLLAINACLLFYDQQARAYSLLMLLTLVSTYLFLRALDEPSTSRLAAYAIVAIASVYVHYFAALVLLIHLLGWWVSDARREDRRPWLITAAVIVVGCIPEAIVAPSDASNIDWLGTPSLHALVTFPTFLSGGPVPYGHAPEIATAILAVLALFWFVREVNGEYDWQTRFAAAWFVLPVLLVFIESRIGKTFWNPRYLIIVLPPFLFMAMAGLTAIPNRVAAAGVMFVLVGLSAINLHKVYVTPSIDNYKASAPYLLAHTKPGDRAFYDAENTESTTGGVDSGVWYYGRLLAKVPPAPVTLSKLRRDPTLRPKRIWFVRRPSDGNTAGVLATIRRRLAGQYRQAGPAMSFGQGPTLALFVRDSATS